MDLRRGDREKDYPGFLELDRVFIELWESYSIRPKVQYCIPLTRSAETARSDMESLFPETTKEGVIDMSAEKVR